MKSKPTSTPWHIKRAREVVILLEQNGDMDQYQLQKKLGISHDSLNTVMALIRDEIDTVQAGKNYTIYCIRQPRAEW